jgi:hypothetical protein
MRETRELYNRRALALRRRHRLHAVAHLRDDVHVLLALDQHAQPRAHDAVVVGDQDPQGALLRRSAPLRGLA